MLDMTLKPKTSTFFPSYDSTMERLVFYTLRSQHFLKVEFDWLETILFFNRLLIFAKTKDLSLKKHLKIEKSVFLFLKVF
jgi:hypothetical protein